MSQQFHVHLRDTETARCVRVWMDTVENGAQIASEPLCACVKGHRTPEAARLCKAVKKAARARGLDVGA